MLPFISVIIFVLGLVYLVRVNYDHSQIGSYKPPLSQIQNELYQALKDIDRIFTQGKLPYTIAYGTLLGAVRHTDFVPWDDDIDLLVEWSDHKQLERLVPAITRAGYRYERLWKLDRIHTQNSFIDIFYVDFDSHGRSHRCRTDMREQCHEVNQHWWTSYFQFTRDDYYPLKRAKFRDSYFPCPNGWHKLLQQWYGERYLTECKTHWWDHDKECHIPVKTIPCRNVKITWPQ